MSAYHFIAVNQQGSEHKGVLEAENEKHVRQLLRAKALIPLKVWPAQRNSTSKLQKGWRFGRHGLTSKELALFTRQFATLLSAGLPIEASLQAVGEQNEKPRIKGLILSVRAKVVEGHTLAAALKDHPEAFSPLFCSTISAGEKTGHLDKVLIRLADYTEQQWQMRQKLKTALIYPSMIVLVAMGIVGFLLEYVVPKMVAVYGHIGQALPFVTELLIAISQGIKQYGFYFLMIVLVSGFSWYQAIKKSPPFRHRVHALLLRLPLIGHMIKTINTARFARTAAILSTSGVPFIEAMMIASQLITNLVIRHAITVAVQHVREGAAIHLALKQTRFFSPMSIHMVASGEASGQLEPMLDRVAANQEEEISRLIEVGLALFEPAIILIMGGVVLFIVLAVLLPIFDLNQLSQ